MILGHTARMKNSKRASTAAAGDGASAVQQAIRRPTQIIPPLLPTSGPAMYGAMRAQSGAMPIIGPGSQRRYY